MCFLNCSSVILVYRSHSASLSFLSFSRNKLLFAFKDVVCDAYRQCLRCPWAWLWGFCAWECKWLLLTPLLCTLFFFICPSYPAPSLVYPFYHFLLFIHWTFIIFYYITIILILLGVQKLINTTCDLKLWITHNPDVGNFIREPLIATYAKIKHTHRMDSWYSQRIKFSVTWMLSGPFV